MPLINQFLSYQHNKQRFFREYADYFSGLIIPLSTAVAFEEATQGFVRTLCSANSHIRYAIDPRTALFQKDWARTDTNVRPAHEMMVKITGDPCKKYLKQRAVIPKDFNLASLKAMTKSIIEFQLGFRLTEVPDKKLKKYNKLLGKKGPIQPLPKPLHLIPPYFQIDKINDDWVKINRACNDFARSINDGVEVRPVVHVQNWDGLVSPQKWMVSVVGDLRSVWLYPNNFRELEQSQERLESYVLVVSELADSGWKVGTLHGGYFAICLNKVGLSDFGNGVGYGEWRDSSYHRGGSPDVRIYMPRLHRFLSAPAVGVLLDEDGDYHAGSSDLLQKLITAGRPLVVSQSDADEHFMECRREEIMFVANSSVAEIVEALDETRVRLANLANKKGPGQELAEQYGPSLKCWRDALTSVA